MESHLFSVGQECKLVSAIGFDTYPYAAPEPDQRDPVAIESFGSQVAEFRVAPGLHTSCTFFEPNPMMLQR